jgi:hypothetical protein
VALRGSEPLRASPESLKTLRAELLKEYREVTGPIHPPRGRRFSFRDASSFLPFGFYTRNFCVHQFDFLSASRPRTPSDEL